MGLSAMLSSGTREILSSGMMKSVFRRIEECTVDVMSSYHFRVEISKSLCHHDVVVDISASRVATYRHIIFVYSSTGRGEI